MRPVNISSMSILELSSAVVGANATSRDCTAADVGKDLRRRGQRVGSETDDGGEKGVASTSP